MYFFFISFIEFSFDIKKDFFLYRLVLILDALLIGGYFLQVMGNLRNNSDRLLLFLRSRKGRFSLFYFDLRDLSNSRALAVLL